MPLLLAWQRQLFLAAHRGDAQGLRKLCEQHEGSVNVTDEAEYTPLTIAIIQGNLAAVQALVSLGATLDEVGMRRQTPVQLACEEGHLEIVAFLIERGADPTRQCGKEGDLLHIATVYGHGNILQWLVQVYGMPVDTRIFETGETALHRASALHRDRLVQWLLAQGADPCLQDHKGRTALHHAVTEACKPQDVPLLTRLLATAVALSKRDTFGRTPLHAACHVRNRVAVQTLLAQDQVDCFSIDALGTSPLYEVATGGGDNAHLLSEFLQALHHRGVPRARIVSELQRSDPQGWTALDHAVFCGEVAHVQRLLAYGVRAASNILHLVGSGVVMHWEERATRDPQAWHQQYQYVKDWMLRYGKYFVQYPAVKNGWPRPHIPPLPRCLVGLEGAFDVKVNRTSGGDDDDDATPIMSELLINQGASVLTKDRRGNLPFFLAAASGQLQEVFVQLRAAAHEGLFQNLQTNKTPPPPSLTTTTTATVVACKRPGVSQTVTPPRQRRRCRLTQLGPSF